MIAAPRLARLGRVSFAVLLGFAFLAALPIPRASAQSGRTLVESRESLYNNVYVYKDGFPDWQAHGAPVHTGAKP